MSLSYNGTAIQGMTYNGANVQSVTMDGVEVWSAISSVLEKNSLETIVEVIQAGQAANYWDVGDTKSFTTRAATIGRLSIPAGQTYKLVILGINHKPNGVDPTTGVHFCIGQNADGKNIAFVDSYYDDDATNAFNFHNTNDDVGWSTCTLRSVVQGFKNILPTIISNAIVASPHKSSAKFHDTSDTLTLTSDEIFILSGYEIWGTYGNYDSPFLDTTEMQFCNQYDYYKNGNTRIRYKHSSPNTSCYWWTRSLGYSAGSQDSMWSGIVVHPRGSQAYMVKTWSYGISPAFVIR